MKLLSIEVAIMVDLFFSSMANKCPACSVDKAASLMQMRQSEKQLAKQQGIFCNAFEVCKCTSDWNETNIQCQSGTCTYSPGAPSMCVPGGNGDAECFRPSDWADCEWANFNGDGPEVPGQDLFVDVPEVGFQNTSGGLLVLTDFDDTIECSGGPPAGADEECLGTKPHQMYPGVGEFTLALARGSGNISNPRKVIPASARPGEAGSLLAIRNTSEVNIAYKEVGEKHGIHDWGLDIKNALYGSVTDVKDFLPMQRDLTRFDRLGYRKYSNWKGAAPRFAVPMAFIGDNGQGDAVAAQMMLKRSVALADSQGAMRMVFIHDVMKRCNSEECQAPWAKIGIYFFSHYAHAASIAFQRGFITQANCETVCEAATSLSCSCA